MRGIEKPVGVRAVGAAGQVVAVETILVFQDFPELRDRLPGAVLVFRQDKDQRFGSYSFRGLCRGSSRRNQQRTDHRRDQPKFADSHFIYLQ